MRIYGGNILNWSLGRTDPGINMRENHEYLVCVSSPFGFVGKYLIAFDPRKRPVQSSAAIELSACQGYKNALREKISEKWK